MSCRHRKVTQTLASGLVSEWLEESYDEFVNEIEVSESSKGYCSNESDPETISSVAPNGHLYKQASPKPFYRL